MAVDEHRVLRVAAERAGNDPFFMGFELRAYKEIFGLDDKELASFLQCTSESLARLSLCRRPDMTSALFRDEIEQIAAYCSANAERLTELVRQAGSVRSFRGMPTHIPMPVPTGMMAAARDRRPRKRATSKKKPEK